MATNYIQAGENVTLAAPYDVTSGDGALVGALFGVAQTTALSGADVVLATCGVWQLTKVGSQAWAVGDLIYWDDANTRCTTGTIGPSPIGVATEAVGSGAGETLGKVRLFNGPVSADSLDATVAVAGATLAIPVTARWVNKTTGGVEALTLADGVFPGQKLSIHLVADGGDGTLTPATSTGWATCVFADVKDTLHLEWIDSTVGWIVTGYSGTAAPPVLT